MGWGGDNAKPVSCSATRSSLALSGLHLHLHVTLLDLYLAFDMKGWGGVRWGGDNTKPVSCSATRSSLALTCYAIRSSIHNYFNAFACGSGDGAMEIVKISWPSLAKP